MSTATHKQTASRGPAQCVGIALLDDGQAVILRPATFNDPELTDDEDLPWLAHRQNKPIIIDLHGVDQFDSDLARWLLHLTNLLPDKNFQLRNVSLSIKAGMRLLGLDRISASGSSELIFAY